MTQSFPLITSGEVYHRIVSFETAIRMRNSGIPEVEVLGDTVGDLMDDRHDADYTLHLRRFTAGTCSEFCDTCQAAIDDFDRYSASVGHGSGIGTEENSL